MTKNGQFQFLAALYNSKDEWDQITLLVKLEKHVAIILGTLYHFAWLQMHEKKKNK
jgi:hypothetical protein